jgi:hypothetical protein
MHIAKSKQNKENKTAIYKFKIENTRIFIKKFLFSTQK